MTTERYCTVSLVIVNPAPAVSAPIRSDAVMDPRIARTRESVLITATDLLVEGGPDALTIEAVVARSGVAKSTLYRHWSTRDELARAVFAHNAPRNEIPEGLPFSEGLRALLRALAATLADDRWSNLVPALVLLARRDPGLADLDRELKSHQLEVMRRLLARGVEEGAVDRRVLDDVGLALTLAAGPLLFASLTGAAPVTDALADEAARQFEAAHRRA